MMKYVRLLRLQDQYLQFSAAIGAGIFLRDRSWGILWWAVAVTLLSFAAFIVNEVTDREDTDKYSWNRVHIKKGETLDMRIVVLMFITCSVAGLLVSWAAGLLWWGGAVYAVGVLYSLEPIRLKKRFFLDAAAQISACLVLPFLGPVWGHTNPDLTAVFLIITTLALYCIVYPYQLADYIADRKARIGGMHVVLGMKTSLFIGFVSGALGFILYLLFGLHRWERWTIPGAVALPIVLIYYFVWLNIPKLEDKVDAIRSYVRLMKPATRILALYVFVVWRFF